MREAVRSCGQNYWKLSGKKSSTSGQRGQRQDFQNGLVSDQAKRKVIQKHRREKMMAELLRRRKNKKLLPKRRLAESSYHVIHIPSYYCFHTKKKLQTATQILFFIFQSGNVGKYILSCFATNIAQF